MSWTFQMATRSPVRYYFIGKHPTVLWMKALHEDGCQFQKFLAAVKTGTAHVTQLLFTKADFIVVNGHKEILCD